MGIDELTSKAIESWLSEPAIAEADKQEIRDLQQAGAESELSDRFYRELEFGTGGMRGTIGAGLNRMNIYTVGAATQGLANYIASQGEAAKKAGVAIAYDCRRMSDAFALRTACVLAANGITAYLFEQLRPTPELSYAVRKLGCTAGVVITASHNPPAYNGYKAYWTGGVQVVPPHDEAIIRQVRSVGGFGNVKLIAEADARAKGLIRTIGSDIDEPFLNEVQASCLNPEVCQRVGGSLKIVFTPLHGTGITLVPEALKRRGFKNVIVVPQQAQPDGNFPTVAYPNPEEAPAMTLGIELAQKENADLVIATDPDADRTGIAVRKDDGQFALITGNQTAALLTWYICETLTQQNRFPANGVVITTIVSSDLMKDIARSYGAAVIEVLTGFKWIGEKVSQFEAAAATGQPTQTYLFGAEESYGYMPCGYTRDKDAVTSAAYIADLAAMMATQGRGLYELLNELYQRFGYFQEGAKSITMPGQEGAGKIKSIMQQLRQQPPRSFGGLAVTEVADILTGQSRHLASGKTVQKYQLPDSDVLLFSLEDGSKVIARPSGTEPKIKFYILTKGPGTDLAQAKADADAKIKAMTADIVTLAQ